MKVLVFVDLHGSTHAYKELKEKAKEVDVILCGGDMTVFENKLSKIIKDISLLGKPTYIIHGNHEDEEDVLEECEKYSNLTFVHKRSITLQGVQLVSFGGEGFSFETPEFDAFMKNIDVKKPSILLLHQPPYDTDLDFVWDEHAGNKTFKRYSKKFSYVFSGHIHETAGVVQKIGTTTYANPGPDGMIFEID